MDVIRNPSSPSAGFQPPELVGRGSILEQARILLGRIKQKRCEKSMLLTGLRGVGKTVLLNEIERLAKREAYHTVLIEVHENKPLGSLLVPHLRTLLFDLDRIAGMSDKLKRGIAVLRSFMTSERSSLGVAWEIRWAHSLLLRKLCKRTTRGFQLKTSISKVSCFASIVAAAASKHKKYLIMTSSKVLKWILLIEILMQEKNS